MPGWESSRGNTRRSEVVGVDGVVPVGAVEELAVVVDHERVDVLAVAELAQKAGQHQLQQVAGSVGHLPATAVPHQLQKVALGVRRTGGRHGVVGVVELVDVVVLAADEDSPAGRARHAQNADVPRGLAKTAAAQLQLGVREKNEGNAVGGGVGQRVADDFVCGGHNQHMLPFTDPSRKYSHRVLKHILHRFRQ